jgi:hypothetical protein
MLTTALASEGSMYVHHHALRLSEDLDINVFQRAWREVVARTDVLRTSFRHGGPEGWTGVVRADATVGVDVVEVAGEDELPGLFAAFVEDGLAGGGDGVDGLLARPVRARLVVVAGRGPDGGPKTTTAAACFVLSLHHSLYDGASLGFVFDDLAAACRGGESGRLMQFFLGVSTDASV